MRVAASDQVGGLALGGVGGGFLCSASRDGLCALAFHRAGGGAGGGGRQAVFVLGFSNRFGVFGLGLDSRSRFGNSYAVCDCFRLGCRGAEDENSLFPRQARRAERGSSVRSLVDRCCEFDVP